MFRTDGGMSMIKMEETVGFLSAAERSELFGEKAKENNPKFLPQNPQYYC